MASIKKGEEEREREEGQHKIPPQSPDALKNERERNGNTRINFRGRECWKAKGDARNTQTQKEEKERHKIEGGRGEMGKS